MTIPGLSEWLQQLSDDELRQFISRVLPAMDKAAHAEFGSRLRSRTSQHGTGCTCCGAGVRQWR
jgi:hypothetical protein